VEGTDTYCNEFINGTNGTVDKLNIDKRITIHLVEADLSITPMLGIPIPI
jgi:hypothetical protein